MLAFREAAKEELKFKPRVNVLPKTAAPPDPHHIKCYASELGKLVSAKKNNKIK